jgi:adenylate cyclase
VTVTIDELKAEALRLNPEERAELASDLLVSLEDLSESEVERLWVEEAMRRDAALDSGAARAIPADEVFAAARARLK